MATKMASMNEWTGVQSLSVGVQMNVDTLKAVLFPALQSATQARTGSNPVTNGRITPTLPTPVTSSSSIGTTPTKAVKTASPTMSASSKRWKTVSSTP